MKARYNKCMKCGAATRCYKSHSRRRLLASRGYLNNAHTMSVDSIHAPKAKDMPKHNTMYDREVQEIKRSIIALKRA